jgi:hypothetical protein
VKGRVRGLLQLCLWSRASLTACRFGIQSRITTCCPPLQESRAAINAGTIAGAKRLSINNQEFHRLRGFVMITSADECSFQIARYQRMARATRDSATKSQCEQLLERWTQKSAKLKTISFRSERYPSSRICIASAQGPLLHLIEAAGPSTLLSASERIAAAHHPQAR